MAKFEAVILGFKEEELVRKFYSEEIPEQENNHKKRLKKQIKTQKKLGPKKFKKKIKIESIKYKKQSLTSKFVRFQLSLKPKFTLKLNLKPEKYIQRFFDKISETISNYKELKKEEKRRIQIEQIERERKEKIKLQKEKQQEEIEITK